jgi:hypothetical protein
MLAAAAVESHWHWPSALPVVHMMTPAGEGGIRAWARVFGLRRLLHSDGASLQRHCSVTGVSLKGVIANRVYALKRDKKMGTWCPGGPQR